MSKKSPVYVRISPAEQYDICRKALLSHLLTIISRTITIIQICWGQKASVTTILRAPEICQKHLEIADMIDSNDSIFCHCTFWLIQGAASFCVIFELKVTRSFVTSLGVRGTAAFRFRDNDLTHWAPVRELNTWKNWVKLKKRRL